MPDTTKTYFDHQGGTDAPWYRGREISEEERTAFRELSNRSREAKRLAMIGGSGEPFHQINEPTLDPAVLMPQQSENGIASLSLYSGGGGLDLGFSRAGFPHFASYDTLEAAGKTLAMNRPEWKVYSGEDGNVRDQDWRSFRGEVDLVHGGPPCQPFSVAGRQRGHDDERNLLPEFVRTVLEIKPAAFVAENVAALAGPKFADLLEESFLKPLRGSYHVQMIRLHAHEFGVPQRRTRVFFVGFRSKKVADRFKRPRATHRADHLLRGPATPKEDQDAELCDGVRSALGLADIDVDALAPTLRSTLTGPRHTTSILSSSSAQKAWRAIEVWPNGVAANRDAARAFPAANNHFRLSVQDCAVLQGFPDWWKFHGPVYMALGQIGNSVAPPVGFQVARAMALAMEGPKAKQTSG